MQKFSEKYICPSEGSFCNTCPPYNMNSASINAWKNRFNQSGGTAPVDYPNGDMMDGYSYCGKQSVKVIGGGKKGGANKNKNLSNKHSNNKMNAKPNVPMRRGGPRRMHRPIDNSQQMKILEEFKAGKIKEDKALAALEELNLPEKKLPLKENIPVLKKAMSEAKSGERELGQVENFIRRIMRKREKWVPRENGNGTAPTKKNNNKNNNKKNNNKKNNNTAQEGGVKSRSRSSTKKVSKASKVSKVSKKNRKSSKKSKKSRKSSKKSMKGGIKHPRRSNTKKSKKSSKKDSAKRRRSSIKKSTKKSSKKDGAKGRRASTKKSKKGGVKHRRR